MSDNASTDIRHYGIPGMKWGRRKSQSSSSDSQPREKFGQKVARDTVQKRIDLHKKVRDREGLATKAVTALDKHTWGRNGRFEKYQNNRIKELENDLARIDQGKDIVKTLLAGPSYRKSA